MPESISELQSTPSISIPTEKNVPITGYEEPLRKEREASVADRLAGEKSFQLFGMIDTAVSDSVPNGQVINVLRIKPAQSSATLSQEHLNSSDLAKLFSALEALFETKLNITESMAGATKNAIDRYKDVLDSQLRLTEEQAKTEVEKLSAQQHALRMSVVGAAVQLATTLLALAGSILNEMFTKSPDTKIQDIQQNPTKNSSDSSAAEIPEDQLNEVEAYVPNANQSEASTSQRSIDTRNDIVEGGDLLDSLEDGSSLEIGLFPLSEILGNSVEESLTIELIPSETSSSLEGQIDVQLTPLAGESSAAQQPINNALNTLENESSTKVTQLRDRIRLVMNGLQNVGEVLNGIITQVGQKQMAERQIAALLVQKEAEKGLSLLDTYIQLIQSGTRSIQKEQTNLLKEAAQLISTMETRAEMQTEAQMKVFRV